MTPGFFARFWPEPAKGAPSLVVMTAIAVGVVVGVSVPLDRAAIGWLIGAVAAGVGIAVVARRAERRELPLGERLVRIGWGVGAVALLGVGTVRAAGWLFALCVLTAIVAAAQALAGGATLKALGLAVVTQPAALVRAVPWVAAGFRARRAAGGGRQADILRLAGVIAGTLVVVLIFGVLFSAADVAFATIFADLLPDPGTAFRWVIVGVFAAVLTLGSAFFVSAPPRFDGDPKAPTTSVRRLEWMIPLVALNLLFAAFVAVQLTVLFGGARHVLETAGLTFAEYARRGFWQLLVVSLLTLVIIGLAGWKAPRSTATDRVLLRVALGVMALLSMVIVASALYRMDVYQQAYGYTRLRVLVSAYEAWLGLLFVMVVAAVVRLNGRWLPQAAFGLGVVALLGLAVLNPDRFIAEGNVDRHLNHGRSLDEWYLHNLSADAVPALDRLPEAARDCVLRSIRDDLAERPDSWYEWNLGRHEARRILAARPVDGGCRKY